MREKRDDVAATLSFRFEPNKLFVRSWCQNDVVPYAEGVLPPDLSPASSSSPLRGLSCHTSPADGGCRSRREGTAMSLSYSFPSFLYVILTILSGSCFHVLTDDDLPPPDGL